MICRIGKSGLVLGDPVSQDNWKGSKVLLYVSSFVKVYGLKPSRPTRNKVQTCEVIDKTRVFSRNEVVTDLEYKTLAHKVDRSRARMISMKFLLKISLPYKTVVLRIEVMITGEASNETLNFDRVKVITLGRTITIMKSGSRRVSFLVHHFCMFSLFGCLFF